MLPDILTPFKHYNEETISGVLDGIVTPEDEDSETCPSEDTMIRWHHWFIINEFNIEGHIKSIGYRLLGFSEISSMVRNFPSGKTGQWCRHIFHLPLTTTRDLYLLLSFMIIRKNA